MFKEAFVVNYENAKSDTAYSFAAMIDLIEKALQNGRQIVYVGQDSVDETGDTLTAEQTEQIEKLTGLKWWDGALAFEAG